MPKSDWDKADAIFRNSWYAPNVPENWEMEHNGIKFWAGLAPFKHTGVFPEQAPQWQYIFETVKQLNS